MERNDDYMTKICMDALDNDVKLDSHIRIVHGKGKLKAYCEEKETYVQFPNHLRDYGKVYLADVVKATNKNCTIFYRVYKGSIREIRGDGSEGRKVG